MWARIPLGLFAHLLSSWLAPDFALGFHLVNRRHQEDFCQREALNRVGRDLEHNCLDGARTGCCSLRANSSCN